MGGTQSRGQCNSFSGAAAIEISNGLSPNGIFPTLSSKGDEPGSKRPRMDTMADDEKNQESEIPATCRPCYEEDTPMHKAMPQPVAPSAEEWVRHQLTHIPFKGWCPICIQAKAKNPPRKKNVKS